MSRQHWLVKSEPDSYSWSTFVREGRAAWTGVRNYAARLHLRAMRAGDLVAFYHSVTEKQVVGLARVAREAYPDPTADDGDWSCVDLVPVQALPTPVTIETIKGDRILAGMELIRQSRLSVSPLTQGQFARLLELGAKNTGVAHPERGDGRKEAPGRTKRKAIRRTRGLSK